MMSGSPRNSKRSQSRGSSPDAKRARSSSQGNGTSSTDSGSQLAQLRRLTQVVADTGDVSKIREFKPQDATTNPSLLLQAVQMPEYKSIVDRCIQNVGSPRNSSGLSPRSSQRALDDRVNDVCDELAVAFGCEILKIVPGYVSTEVDASLSFDTKRSVEKARKFIRMYEKAGWGRDRILIKLGSTWEGIRACEILEKEGIKCNMTLLFSFAQAVACAEANATLISPFVGRILDWYKKAQPDKVDQFTQVTDPTTGSTDNDPGVLSVKKIFDYYRDYSYKTIVMGASFRNTGEILALAGCDKLTIGPKLLEEMEKNVTGRVERKLVRREGGKPRPSPLSESQFRWQHNEDAMATEKLAEGIRNFNVDAEKLKAIVKARLQG